MLEVLGRYRRRGSVSVVTASGLILQALCCRTTQSHVAGSAYRVRAPPVPTDRAPRSTPKEKIRRSWLASNPSHQFWWYWCIGLEDPRAMNTFIERPAIEARLLYWLSALHAVNGMLYYDVMASSIQHCPFAVCRLADQTR